MKALEKGDFEIVDKSGKKLKKIRIEKMTTSKKIEEKNLIGTFYIFFFMKLHRIFFPAQ